MMTDISLTGVLVVAAIAFTVPLVLGLAPKLRLPSVVLEIVVGIVIGPAILGLVEVDLADTADGRPRRSRTGQRAQSPW